jgi:AAHS family 4-hydroxybenzoate transporter-like MFS transporter
MPTEQRMTDKPVIDVTALIDAAGMRALQIRTVVLCGMAALLDGLDLQSIGLAAPGIIATLHVPPRSFGLVFSAALLGLMLGAFCLGPVADRIGRRRILIGALAVFGVFTLCTAFATSFEMLLGLRFLAGVGLGGAMPSFISLGSEYAPRRKRAVMVGLLWAGFPLGGVLGGVLGSWIIPVFGWPSIFYVGGVLPLLLALVLVAALPESIGFLVARDHASSEIATLIGRITGHPPPPGARFVLGEERPSGVSLRHLFSHGRAAGTVLLWIAYFAIFLMLVTNTAWSPTLLQANGMALAQAAIAMAAFNAGSVIGTSLAGVLITTFDAYRSLAILFIASAVSFGLIGEAAPSFAGTAALQGLTGLFLGAGSSGLIAAAAMFYPTATRSTGVGWAMGMGRLGSFAGPLVVGLMVGARYDIVMTYGAVGCPALVAAGCMVLLGSLRRRGIPDHGPTSPGTG